MEDSGPRQINETKIAASDNPSVIDTCALVLSSKNIDHRIEYQADEQIALLVSQESAEQARYQLSSFFTENRNWPPPQIIAQRESFPSLLPTLVTIGALAFFYMITGPWHQDAPWFATGANDADLVLKNGEYFRLVTALTLHADISHLAGNCLIGGFLIYFFLQINGPGLGLLAIIISGSTGNLINDLLHGGDHLSVGFSTAVFALIGMLSIYQIVEQKQPIGIRMFAPFMAGAALLAMLGSSGVRTDLGAHLFGLAAGFAFGLVLASHPVRKLRTSLFIQLLTLAVSTLILVAAWGSALSPTV